MVFRTTGRVLLNLSDRTPLYRLPLKTFPKRIPCLFRSAFPLLSQDCPKDTSVLKIVRRTNPVLFCHRRSFSVPVPFSCLSFLEKEAFLSPLRGVLLGPCRIFFLYRNSLSVVFLQREGPLGVGVRRREAILVFWVVFLAFLFSTAHKGVSKPMVSKSQVLRTFIRECLR